MINSALLNRVETMTNSDLDSRINCLCKRYIQAINSTKRITKEETLLRKYAEMNTVDTVLQILLEEASKRSQKRFANYQQRYEAILIKRYGE